MCFDSICIFYLAGVGGYWNVTIYQAFKQCNYIRQEGIIFMFVCLQDYTNTTGWNFILKSQKIGLGPTEITLSFESPLDLFLETNKKKSEFSHLLFVTNLGGFLCSLSVLVILSIL